MRRLLVITLTLLCFNAVNAQKQIFDLLNKPMYEARVKLVDEFFARFNGAEKRKNVSEEYSDRKSNIFMLFNLAQFKSKKDSLFLAADSFVQEVTNKNVYLNYADSCWYAKVKCHGTLGKNRIDFILYLSVEKRGDDMYKWAISDAEGEMFVNSRNRQHRELFLSPNDHEQSFMSLSRVTTETNRYIDDYARNGYEADRLSVFLTLVRCGQLKIDYVSDVEFVFLQVPGYKFSIKHFERESMNVGWLISSVERCEDTEKVKMISSLHLVQNKITDSLNNKQFFVAETNDTCAVLNNNKKAERAVSETIIQRFSEDLKSWIMTKDSYYRENIIKMCAGKECLVSDSLMVHFAVLNQLPQNETYLLESYLAGFTKFDKLDVEISDIKQLYEDDNFYVVSSSVSVSDAIEGTYNDLFYIRKNGKNAYKISRICNNHGEFSKVRINKNE